MWNQVIFLCLALFTLSLVSANGTTPYIFGGEETTIEKYPFMVVLLHKVTLNIYIQFCGGSILTPTAILTAAHCVYRETPSNWKIRAGSTYANRGGVKYNVSSFVIHPNFNNQNLDSDVAIIRPSTPIVFGDVVKPATIATSSFVIPDNAMVEAAGWGFTEREVISNVLKHVRYPIVNHDVCVQLYAVINIEVTDNMICAGDIVNGGKDQCAADSGSPLMLNGTIIGIASGGKNCGDPKFPGIDAKISNFYDWIKSTK